MAASLALTLVLKIASAGGKCEGWKFSSKQKVFYLGVMEESRVFSIGVIQKLSSDKINRRYNNLLILPVQSKSCSKLGRVHLATSPVVAQTLVLWLTEGAKIAFFFRGTDNAKFEEILVCSCVPFPWVLKCICTKHQC